MSYTDPEDINERDRKQRKYFDEPGSFDELNEALKRQAEKVKKDKAADEVDS